MEAGESLMDKAAVDASSGGNGLELIIRCVNDRTCFVALPRAVADALARTAYRVPLPLALAPRASLPRSNGRVPNSAEKAPPFAAWAGAVSGCDGAIEIPLALADCLGLKDGEPVRVAGRPSAPIAAFVELKPETERDWDAILAVANEIETNALRQVGCVAVGQAFPFWPKTTTEKPLRVVACAASPSAPGGVARLGLETELRIAPWTPSGAAGASSVAGALGAGTNTNERTRTNTSGKTNPATAPAMLRVQSSRGVVAAWPRRLRDAARDPPEPAAAREYLVSAAPTCLAFVSSRTARALGLEDGAIVRVFARRERNGGETEAFEKKIASSVSNNVQRCLTLRATATDAAAVADGHVVLTRAVRDALDVGQGDRVFAQELVQEELVQEELVQELKDLKDAVTVAKTSSPARPALLRLRPVRSLGSGVKPLGASPSGGASRPAPPEGLAEVAGGVADGVSSETGNDGDDVFFLEPAHRAALGVTAEADRAALDAAAARLTMRWIKTQASFFGARSASRGAKKTPKTETSAPKKRALVPVRTGTLLRFSLANPAGFSSAGSPRTATFAVEARAAGGRAVALFDADELFGDEAGEEDAFARAARAELGPPADASDFSVSKKNSSPRGRDGTAVSRRLGDAVATHPALDELPATALGAQAETAVAFATAKLKAALRLRPELETSFGFPEKTISIRSPTAGGALFWGAPGSGRTNAAREAARRLRDDTDVHAAVVSVECARIPSAQGDARPAIAALRRAAEEAVRRAPSVVVLDDLDAVAGDAEREGGEFSASGTPTPPAALVAEALGDLMDATSGEGRVAWLATARDPESLAEAVRCGGRFDHEAELKAPEEIAGRVERFAAAAEARGTPVRDACDPAIYGQLVQIARGVEGYARGDFDALVERAASEAASRWFLEPLDGEETEKRTKRTFGGSLGLTAADLVAARRGFVPAPERALGGTRDPSREDAGSPENALKSVGGLARAKASLEEALSLPSRYPSVFKNAPLRLRTGALLYGPPGCGKTLLARAAVRASGLRLIAVKGPELLNKYIGQSEAGVRSAFRRAASAAPCALFFDEFDAIAPRRGHDTTGVTDRVVNAFLTELDGVEKLEGVVVLAATSRPDLVDPALLRPGRLDRMLACPFPTREERLEILRALTGSGDGDVSGNARETLKTQDPLDLASVAKRTEGFSGADLRGVVSDAALFAERRGVAERETAEDVRRAVALARASVSAHERRRLEAIYAAFAGEKGGDADEPLFAAKKIAHA